MSRGGKRVQAERAQRNEQRNNSRGTKAIVDHGAPVGCSKCKVTGLAIWFVTPGHTSCSACRKPGVVYLRAIGDDMARRFHREHRQGKPWTEDKRQKREVLPLGPLPVRIHTDEGRVQWGESA